MKIKIKLNKISIKEVKNIIKSSKLLQKLIFLKIYIILESIKSTVKHFMTINLKFLFCILLKNCICIIK